MMTNHEIDLRPRDVMTNDKAYYDMTELKLHGTIKRRESATKNIINRQTKSELIVYTYRKKIHLIHKVSFLG